MDPISLTPQFVEKMKQNALIKTILGVIIVGFIAILLLFDNPFLSLLAVVYIACLIHFYKKLKVNCYLVSDYKRFSLLALISLFIAIASTIYICKLFWSGIAFLFLMMYMITLFPLWAIPWTIVIYGDLVLIYQYKQLLKNKNKL